MTTRTLRLSAGVVCLAVLALLPEYVSTRRADTWAVGDLFVGVGSPGWNPGRIAVYDKAGNPRSTIQIPRADAGYSTGCYYNPDTQTLFATTFDANAIHEFDGTRSIRRTDVSALGAGVVAVESIAFNTQGDRFYVGLPWSTPQMGSYAFSQVNGASDPQAYSVAPGVARDRARADWLDLTVEGGETVVYYTDESAYDRGSATLTSMVYRYVPSTGLRTVFAVVPEPKAYALRLLPRGGGMLVAGHAHIYRFNMAGAEVFRYNVVGGGSFFALNITPDGRHFWTATADVENPGISGWLHKFNISASKNPVISVHTGAPVVSGLCVKLEYTASRDVCSDESTGQSIICPRLEVCTEGPDDDGDGLDDLKDPDCARPGTTPDGPPPPPGNQPPICALAAPSIGQIWPPNHKLVEIAVLGVTDPEGDPVVIQIGGIQQDEPTNTQGDGNTSIDGAISADGTKAFVRAERIGTPQAPGDGRVYEILFTATAGGQSCTGSVRVGVPHDQGGMPVPVRSPATYNSLTGARIN